MIGANPRTQWTAAYRAARLVCRGDRREDLKVAPDYTSACRHSNAAQRIASAVAHATGTLRPGSNREDDFAASYFIIAAIQAVGGPCLISRVGPHPLDFEAYATWSAWCEAERQKAAA